MDDLNGSGMLSCAPRSYWKIVTPTTQLREVHNAVKVRITIQETYNTYQAATVKCEIGIIEYLHSFFLYFYPQSTYKLLCLLAM